MLDLPVMHGKTILIHTGDKLGGRRLSGHLRAAGNEVVVSEDAAATRDLLLAHAVDLVVVDAAAAAPRDVVAAARDHAPVIVVGKGGDEAELLAYVGDLEVDHYVGRAAEDDGLDAVAREAAVTAEKLLRGDLFGLAKYLPAFGVEESTFEVRGATDRDDVVECVADHASWLGAGSEARRAVAAVVDELVTNAVYDAPRDDAGQPRHAARDRREKITLEPHELVTVRWASDGDRLAVAVTDRFGALGADHLRRGLRRCLAQGDQIEQKAGGAGLGLYTALSSCAQLVVNVEPGVRTEVVAILELRRGQGVRRGGRSLHLFGDPGRARAAGAEAVPATVEVSPSLLVEVREHLAPARRPAAVVPLVRRRRTDEPAPAAVVSRARGSSPPPASPVDAVDAFTACGLLRGALAPDHAVTAGLRFLTRHYQAAVAYAVDGDRLDARLHAGEVRDWAMLRKLHLLTAGPAAVAALSRHERAQAFEPAGPLDYRVALWTAGVSEAPGLVIPVRVAGTLRWVLYAAGPLPGSVVTPTAVVQVHRELETSLLRLDDDEPEIEVRWG